MEKLVAALFVGGAIGASGLLGFALLEAARSGAVGLVILARDE